MKVNTTDRRGGFTLMELLVVVAIILVVAGLSLPTISRAIENARLKGSAQSVASLYQQARMRAAQDDTYYEVISVAPGTAGARLCLDLNGDGQCQPNEPFAILPAQVAVSNAGVPVTITAAQLGGQALTTTEYSTMYNQSNQNVPGLAWNARGVPCQRGSIASPCAGPIEWVQYVQWKGGANNNSYAAVTVSPTGEIRVWTYTLAANGNGSWQ